MGKIIEIVPGFSPTNKLNKAIWAKARNFTVHFDPLTKAWLAARGQFAGKPMAIDFTNRSESNRTRTTGK